MIVRLFILFILFPLGIFGQIKLTDDVTLVGLDSGLYILKPDRQVGAEEISSLRDEFIHSQVVNPNLGLSRHNTWVRFEVKNESRRSRFLLNVAYPLLDDVELYQVDPMGRLNSIAHLGSFKKFADRIYKHPNYVFDVYVRPFESKEYYLRVRSAEQIILPLSLGVQEHVWQEIRVTDILLGLYLGVVLIMALYNFFLFLSVRDYSYLHYVIYVVFLGLTQCGMAGFNFQFLWPNNPMWEEISVILFACISGIAVLFFADHFLNLKKNSRLSRLALFGLFLLFATAFITTIAGVERLGFQIMQLATTLEAVTLFAVSMYLLLKRYRPAVYFFMAWAILLIGALIFLLKDYGVLPYTTFTSNSFRLASIIEMALLSFALAARINILKKEKDASQARELAILLENERLVREQNILLEQKVDERTQELTASNVSLQETLLHLKETQSQLVEAEKMASLGQLTAGVAHEINNPINFVTSNVAPLKRDIKMIWDTLDEVERIAFSPDLSAEDKQERIQAYKEDIDIAYLKTEVDFLLKGMHDGAHRTAEIVKSLRIFSRVDEDSFKFVDINEGVESTMVILNTLIKEGITVEKRYGDLPKIECDAGKMNQVFLNILNNAIFAINQKFKNTPGGQLKIETGIHQEPTNIYIRITDNGVGIPEDIREKIFEPFFTTKDVGEGTGLGMSITYNTIAKHHGKIEVESEEGKGTVFTIIIPIHQNFSEDSL